MNQTFSLRTTEAVQDAGGPFDLDDEAAYTAWRKQKLAAYPRSIAELFVPIANPFQLTEREREALASRCQKANIALYKVSSGDFDDKELVRRLGKQLGLVCLDDNLCADEDSITSLRVMTEGRHKGYIPYTSRRLNWHTDGYYNLPEQQIRAIIMHCVSDAATGGENLLVDHEIAYILMRDENPDYIAALMAPDAMTIPANQEDGVELRPTQTGPVFSLDLTSGSLHMRYTARTRNIVWKADAITQAAVAFLAELLDGDSPYIFRYRLGPGEGIICNNVIHARTAFEDAPDSGQRRLLYRARYYDRVAG